MVEESFNIEVAAMRGGNAGEGDDVQASRDGSEDPGLGVQDAATPEGLSQLLASKVFRSYVTIVSSSPGSGFQRLVKDLP